MASDLVQRKRRLRAHHEASSKAFEAWRERGYCYPPPRTDPLPNDLAALPCGATTRAGKPCRRTDIMLNGRCKLHGGMSTGPRSVEGRQRSLENLRKRWAAIRTP